MNNIFRFTNWGVVIYAFVICSGMFAIFLKYDIIWLIILTIVLFFTSFLWVSVIKIYEDSIVVTYPFRFLKKEYSLCYSEVRSILFHVMASKASSEYLVFYLKNGAHKKIMLDVNNVTIKTLLFFQSKGIDIVVKGTEHNSIDDLHQEQLTPMQKVYNYFLKCLFYAVILLYEFLLFFK